MTDSEQTELEAINYRRGWRACQERVLVITHDFTGQGVIIHALVKKLECPV